MIKLIPYSSLLIGASLFALTGCGGGGGGGGGGSKPTDTAPQNSSSSQSSVSANNPDFDIVTGVYDASITNNSIKDESYLYISGAGKVTAYNYLGDGKDAGNNCYRIATEKDINTTLNGKSLTYSKANSEYTTTIDGTSIAWKIDSTTNSISKIVYGGAITSSKISLTSGGVSLVIDSKKITTPNITDITSSLCK